MVLVLLTSLNCYMYALRLVHYALLLTPACWKSSNTNARFMAFALFLALDPTFGIYSHKTLDTAQPFRLLKPNWKPPLLTVFPPQLISIPNFCYSHCVHVCVCVHVSVCDVYVFQCYKWFWSCLPLNCYMSTLCLVHYALLLTPTCWKSSNTNARFMAFALPLALDATSGIHSHKTLDTAQPCHLLKPNWKPSSSHSISILTNISTQFLLQSVYVCVCVCVLSLIHIWRCRRF